MRELIPSSCNLKILQFIDTLAAVYCKQNKLNDAERMHKESLEIKKIILPADHPEIALSLSNLAITLSLQNKFTEAMKYNRECLGIRQRTNKKDDIAISMINLGYNLIKLYNINEAEILLEEGI
jgi:tetratricopeptide (TPR) repeat protein